MPSSDDRSKKLTGVLDQIVEETDESSNVTLGEMLDAIKHRSYGPLLFVPALIAISPVGGIPGMSIVTGTIILLISAQILLGKEHPWLPRIVRKMSIPQEKLAKNLGRVKPKLRWLQKLVHERLAFLTEPPSVYLIAAICVVLAASFIPLALLPFAVAVPGIAVACFGLGLMARDGVMILIGLAVAAAAVTMTVFLWPF